jgi:hypothetical protein
MLFLKACPRCRGDLVLDKFDQELTCLQCSYSRPFVQTPVAGRASGQDTNRDSSRPPALAGASQRR